MVSICTTATFENVLIYIWNSQIVLLCIFIHNLGLEQCLSDLAMLIYHGWEILELKSTPLTIAKFEKHWSRRCSGEPVHQACVNQTAA